MAAEFAELCGKVWRAVEARIKRRGNISLSFVTNGTAEDVLHNGKLAELYRVLYCLGPVEITESIFIQRINERQLHKFLTILLYARLSTSAAQSFVRNLIACNSWPVPWAGRHSGIHTLPAELPQLEELFGTSRNDAALFYNDQPRFCAVVIGETEKVSDLNCVRLPYLREKELGIGAYGRVFEVEVAERHFRSGNERQYNTHPKVVARKDYIIDTGFDPEEERRIMSQIARSRHDNILTNYGSMRVIFEDTDTFSLFMPRADFDLRKYMLEIPPPTATEGKEKLVACARGLAQGLHFLHHEMETPEGERLICYHMDLKPANILVFGVNDVEMIWKLSDFGMASVKIERSGGQQDREKGFTSWFRRNGTFDPSVSDTINPRGDGTYLAPESVGKSPEMNRASDVWALGCVLSVFFTYLEQGGPGIAQYSERRAAPTSGVTDRFFLKDSGMTSLAREHLAVKQWHKTLAARAADRSEQEGQVLKSILEAIDARVIRIDKNSRCRAGDVADMLKKCHEGYKKLRDVPPGPDGMPSTLPRRPTMMERILHPTRSSQKQHQIDEYCYLETKESFKDCAISDDGNSAAFWVGKRICHCLQGFIWGQKKGLTPVTYHLESSDEWNSVSLTRQYLVASTTSNMFECFIIDLRGQFPVYHHIALDMPRVHHLAISELEDGSQGLVCLLGAGEQSGPGSIFYVPIADLIESAPSPQPLEKLTNRYIRCTNFLKSEVRAMDRMVTKLSWEDDSRWLASDVVHMYVPKGTVVHLVVKNQRTPTIVTVVYVPGRLSQDDIGVANFTLDKASSLTTIAPFRDHPAFAYITHGKEYGRQYYASDPSHASFQGKTIAGFQICQLITGRDDDEMFAIGKEAGRDRMWLLQIVLLDQKRKPIVTRLWEFPELSHQHFTARLPQVGMGAGKFILVASIERGRLDRRMIYRANLPAHKKEGNVSHPRRATGR